MYHWKKEIIISMLLKVQNKWDFRRCLIEYYCRQKPLFSPPVKTRSFTLTMDMNMRSGLSDACGSRGFHIYQCSGQCLRTGNVDHNNKLGMVKTSRMKIMAPLLFEQVFFPKEPIISGFPAAIIISDKSDTLDDGRIYSFTWKKY